jgi:hypothetical protein
VAALAPELVDDVCCLDADRLRQSWDLYLREHPSASRQRPLAFSTNPPCLLAGIEDEPRFRLGEPSPRPLVSWTEFFYLPRRYVGAEKIGHFYFEERALGINGNEGIETPKAGRPAPASSFDGTPPWS